MNGFDVPDALHVPQGDLLRSRVVDDVAETLDAVLDRGLTGYAVVEPAGSLLLGDEAMGVLTFEDGIPVVAYCETTDEGGADALAALAGANPCAVDLYELPVAALDPVHDTPSFRVPPGSPAEELAADPALAERTRERAPADRLNEESRASAVESFLQDEQRIAEIQQEARAEAAERAAEWGLDEQLADE
ncbi:MAG: hypothetical protein ABEH90_07830 [Halolamina sp.]